MDLEQQSKPGAGLTIEGQDASLRQTLVAKAIEAIAWEGVQNISMRSISALAGGTTAAIVHHYGRKAGLVSAALSEALDRDAAFHQALRSAIAGHRLGYLNFVEWVADYLDHRRNDTNARFWSEILFHARLVKGGVEAVGAWHDMRLHCWAEILETQGCHPRFASHLVTYLCMEEVWAQGLGEFAEYGILQRETLRALTANMFGRDWAERDSISNLVEPRLARFSLAPSANAEELQERLLWIAANDIFEHGIGGLNQKRISSLAEVSPSMIAYHFGGMTNFRIQAVWRAMIHRVADPLNPYGTPRQPQTLDDWAAIMAEAIAPPAERRPSSFYMAFARMVGEIALLSHREPELRPLVEHLRILDGTASYQAGRTIWKDLVRFERGRASAFAMWMKGFTVLSEIFPKDALARSAALKDAVTTLIRPVGSAVA